MTDELREAEATAFPPIPDDKVWCDIRNALVLVNECATNCVSVEHRPVCWLGKMMHDPVERFAGIPTPDCPHGDPYCEICEDQRG